MPHEIEKESLSAFLDAELPAGEHARIQAHLASCAECQGYVSRISAASTAMKRHGKRPLPPTVEAVAIAEARSGTRRRRLRALVGAIAAAVCVTVAGALAMKHFLPGMFAQINGMISGAANSLGQ